MYLQDIVLSLALLCFITAARSEPQCVFSIPSLLKSGEMARGCLEVKYHTEPVDVDITLEVNGENHAIFNGQVPVGNNFNCLEFKVPSISSSVRVFFIVKASATNYNYTARRAVVVHPTKKVTLMQMKRASYKPGQEVRFNLSALDNNLKPVENKTTVNYNTPVREVDSAFQVSVYIPPKSCVNGVAYTIPVNINVSYHGPRNESNIVIIDVAMPSGYSPEPESLAQLKSKVARVEMNDHLFISIKKLRQEITNIKFLIARFGRMLDMEPQYVRVYDAHVKEENGVAVLRHPCSTQ